MNQAVAEQEQERIKESPLRVVHEAEGARLVEFAGYHLPVQFPQGILAEHRHTRESASLFDVSHMGQLRLRGADIGAALDGLLPIAAGQMAIGEQKYTLLLNDAGGIIDDLIVARLDGDEFHAVVNASRVAGDLAHIRARLGKERVEWLEDRALIALQGPRAADILEPLCPAVTGLSFMESIETRVARFPCLLSRCGYTGEDGFELSLKAGDAPMLASLLLDLDGVAPAGLGARDTLRLEAGLCLYGSDIDEDTTPGEASLGFAIAKARRPGGTQAGGFPGAERIFQEIDGGPQRRRVGLQGAGRLAARAGAVVEDADGHTVGHVSSGVFSPTLEQPIAFAYVRADRSTPGTPLTATVRGHKVEMTVVTQPFVPHRYHRRR